MAGKKKKQIEKPETDVSEPIEGEEDEKLSNEELDELAAEIGVEREGDEDDGDSSETDKPATPPSKEDKGSSDEAPDDAGGEDDAEDTTEGDDAEDGDDSDVGGGLTLGDLKNLGIGEFESVEDARKALRNLRGVVGRQNEDARLGRMVREARESGLDPAALFQDDRPKPRAQQPDDAPLEYDPAWDRVVKPKFDDDGNQVGYEGPPEIVAKVEQFHAQQTELWNRIYRGDRDAMNRMFGPLIEERARALTQEQEQKVAMDGFMKAHGDFLVSNGLEDDFLALMDQGASPELAVEVLQARIAKKGGGEEAGDEGESDEDAKNADLEKLKQRTRKKPQRPAPPVTPDDDLDLDNMDEEAIARLAAKRAGIEL